MLKNWVRFKEKYGYGKKQSRISSLEKIESFLKEKRLTKINLNNSFAQDEYELLKQEYQKWNNGPGLTEDESIIFSHFWNFLNFDPRKWKRAVVIWGDNFYANVNCPNCNTVILDMKDEPTKQANVIYRTVNCHKCGINETFTMPTPDYIINSN